MDCYRLEVRLYRRPFQTPLHTSHGCWQVRDGLIVRLENKAGQVGFGEIAPLAWLGSESLERAIAFCQRCLPMVTSEQIMQIPDTLPATQFGLGMALERVGDMARSPITWTCSQLLPTGVAALQVPLSPGGTYKWKIGTQPLQQEQQWLQERLQDWPLGAKLRLDANGGLDQAAAIAWLQVCDRLNQTTPVIEFLEQPLPADQVPQMQQLGDRYTTPIALDESLATMHHVRHWHQRGWRGIGVVKPAIAGFPQTIRQVCTDVDLDVVWSSVFETPMTQRFIAQHLAPVAGDRAVGFGINHWFVDAGCHGLEDEDLWATLPPLRT
ncbi:MAG: o-succinylbenzoate synthase [Leptolyngbya sp. DLM2.Bin15]|nr:MAG: o-succinylbenzoate synthase [Leptolyngbya sp. DLM2.Bin15]